MVKAYLRYTLVCLVLFVSSIAIAQTYHKVYNSIRNIAPNTPSSAVMLKQVLDGNFISIGETESYGAGGMDLYIMKTDVLGNILWYKTFGSTTVNEIGIGFVENLDGTLLVLGTTNLNGGDFYVIKTDVDGNILWQQTYGGAGFEDARGIGLASNGDILLTGIEGTAGSSFWDMYVLRLDATGGVIWTKAIGNQVGALVMNSGMSIIETADQKIIVSGVASVSGSGTGRDMVLVKLRSNGSKMWDKTYASAGTEEGYTVIERNGGYYLTGYTTGFGPTSGILMKTDTSGAILWQKQYEDLSIRNMESTSDGGFILAGNTTTFGNGGFDGVVLKVDALGNLEWAKVYGDCLDEKIDYAYPVPGGYLLGGSHEGAQGIYHIRTDSLGNGNIACFENSPIITVSNTAFVISTFGTDVVGASKNPVIFVTSSYSVRNADLACVSDTADFTWLAYTQCTNDSTIFTSNYTTNNGFPISYEWDFGDGNNSTLENPKNIYLAAGTYNVQLIINWACSLPDTVTYPITIVNGVTPSISFLVVPPDTICDIINLTFFPSNADTIIRVWGDGIIDGQSPSLFVANHTYQTDGDFTYYVIVENSCGRDSITGDVYVRESPVVGFTKDKDTICVGEVVNLTDVSTSPFTINSWIWSFGDFNQRNNIYLQQNPSIDYQVAGVYNVTLTIEDENGCATTSALDTIVVTQDSLVKIAWTEGCPCNEISFMDTASISSSSWLWQFGDGTTSSTQNPTKVFSSPGEYYVTLKGLDADGCFSRDEKMITVCDGQFIPASKSSHNWITAGVNPRGFNFNLFPAEALNSGVSVSGEEMATISDPQTGNLLFYTDFRSVWDNTDVTMPNGTGLLSAGSTSQGVVLPMPGNTNQYLIISLGYSSVGNVGAGSLRSTLVDLSLGANGEVVAAEKNVIISSNTGAEQVTAIKQNDRDCNGLERYWIVSPYDVSTLGEFKIFSVDSSGILVPTIQNIGSGNNHLLGKSQFSLDGSKYVCPTINGFELFDFDITTGVLSNMRFVNLGHAVYGTDFSSDGTKLYISTPSTAEPYLYQYDATSASSVTLTSSQVLIYTLSAGFIKNLELAPNGKIYIGTFNNGYVSVINSPNLAGTNCDFQSLGLNTNTGFGLQHIVNLDPSDIYVRDTVVANFTADTSVCANVIFTNLSDTLSVLGACDFSSTDTISYSWDFGDGNTSTIWSPTHTYATTGPYTAQLIVDRPFMCASDTFTQLIQCPVVLTLDFLSFNAKVTNEHFVKLDWSTIEEKDVDYFTLERSKGGNVFEKFGETTSNGNGNNNYVSYDEHPYSGISYYRIKSVNENKTFSYSNIDEVYLGEIDIINLYPNPASNSLTLLVAAGYDMEIKMNIWNSIGQNVKIETYQASKGSNSIAIDVSNLASGTYMIKLVSPRGEYVFKEFLVR